MTGNDGIIDDEALREYAMATVKEAIGASAVRHRRYGEGKTNDKALLSELRDIARASIDHNFTFAPGLVRNYLVNYHDIVYRPSTRGTIAESIKAAIVESILDDANADIAEAHATQFVRTRMPDVGVWCENGLRVIRSHGDPVSKEMWDTISGLDENTDEHELADLTELIRYVAGRVEAHAAYQTRDVRPDYETLARRLREVGDYVDIRIVALRVQRTPDVGLRGPSP